ncbi:hypothetical protein [Planctobacterium marinum]|uniref:PRC-barrel domain-containing protein n=1 Tax=Planctobacterium marinum TaxID=1631968 RepID=A0AA48HHY3_9ALTE|nr:hypothetical protein MACH26_11550 [Planctobacterium marinum]
MLHSLNALEGYLVLGSDEELGYCKDFLFNDEHWNAHYMLIDTHKWLPGGKKALVHSKLISHINSDKQEIHLQVSKSQLKQSPSLLSNDPIARAYEKTYMCYFDYATWHVGPQPLDTYLTGVHPERVKLVGAGEEPASEKNHVHSANFVEDYELESDDKKHGHIKDFILNDENWDIAYLAIEMNRVLGHKHPILLNPSELEHIDWSQQKVIIDLPEKQILNSSAYHGKSYPSKGI